MNQLIARRGAIPRHVLDKGRDATLDIWMETAVTGLNWEDIMLASPGSARASHRIAAIHPIHWQDGELPLHARVRLLCSCYSTFYSQN